MRRGGGGGGGGGTCSTRAPHTEAGYHAGARVGEGERGEEEGSRGHRG